ncbi:hypothetical protein ABID14_000382 [Peptoniphilus olsenii]|uniref:Uncharacterized protein n=1 Tax=Peptoniphilus olsenii TaxID=411570 RepID=A0ABV2J7M2_9FIRM
MKININFELEINEKHLNKVSHFKSKSEILIDGYTYIINKLIDNFIIKDVQKINGIKIDILEEETNEII